MVFKKSLFATILLFFSFVCYSNPISKELARFNDSIQNVIRNETNYKDIRIQITELLNRNYVTNMPFVIAYIEDNILNNPKYMTDSLFYANTVNTYAICFLNTDIHKCIEIAKSGIKYIGTNQNPEILEKLALLNSNLANALAILGHHNTRLKVFADIHPIILKTKNPQIIRNYNFKLGEIYFEFNELDKALNHLRNGIFVEDDFVWHPNFAGITETYIAAVYLKKNEIDSLRKYINLANNIKRAELPIIFDAKIKNLLGISMAYENQLDSAFELINEAEKIALSIQDTSEYLLSNYLKGRCFAIQKQYNKAIEIYNTVLYDFNCSNFDHYRYYVLMSLIEAYKQNGQLEKAFETYHILLNFLDQQKVNNQQLYAEELSYNMKLNEKIAEIERLKNSNEKADITKERNQLFIGILVISLLLLLVVLFLVINAKKRNKIVGRQKYALLEAKLEEEKNNHMIDEMKLLKQVEDRERNRIATDLHDSVGGLLSSIKIALFDYQETKGLSDNELEHTNRILAYVDETKQELNRIVYNLTPLIVEKFGLLEAIKQYCKKVQSENFSIDLQIINVPANIVIEDEITLYRIIQELLHNVVKHAHAHNALIQIQTNYKNGMVIISVEDDGDGMNVEDAKTKGGLGMRSLYSRVHHLNGTIKIESLIDQGTAVYITCYPKSLDTV